MDRLQRGINGDQTIRVVVAVTTDLVREACDRHELAGAAAVVLGRALTAGCLLSTLSKNDEERVRIDMRGGGTVGTILIDSRANGTVRGCLTKRIESDAPMVAGRRRIGDFVGTDGNVVVTRDLGLENQYQGTVPLASGEIDDDIEQYLNDSEQLPSALGCEATLDARNRVLRCAGVLCQTLPGNDRDALDAMRDNLRSGALRELLHQDRTPEELMGFALLGGDFEALGTTDLQFRCTCSDDRALSVVSTLGADDIDSLADEPGDTEVRCSFCGSRYSLTADQLHGLATRLRSKRS